jgi:hypothetical protein
MYEFHYGVDILYPRAGEPPGLPMTAASGKWAVPERVPAVAYADGVVIKSSWTGTGDRVRIDHGEGLETGYMHLRDRKVRVGEKVRAGQVLGRVSFNPWKRGAPAAEPPPAPPRQVGLNHLHFEVYKNGKQVDPGPFLKNAIVQPVPSSMSWLLAGGLAIAVGLFASRYVR